ncbi:MAG TPA: MarR family transcriptional regulator [Methylomirabilota bacterium]|nr:MarR family transcriptional regulator [Methylomirabilota bacterium]
MTLSNDTRAADKRAILDELSAADPRERMAMFRRWLAGSLSIVQLFVLAILESDGPLPMGKVAEALDVSVASATGIIDRMEQRGIVERGHQPDDRRIVLVSTTSAGRAILSDLDEHRRATIGRILDRLTDRELGAFLKGLRAMRAARAAMDAEGAAAPPGGAR